MLMLYNYNSFLLNSGIQSISMPSTLYSSAPLHPNVTLFTTFSALKLSTNLLMHNVKLDLKQHPIFNDKNTNWPKSMRGVLSIASTHDLDKVFDKNTIIPFSGDPNSSTYWEKSKSVYSTKFCALCPV